MAGETMVAGREMDALIAEKVMGWERSIVGNMPWQLIPPGEDRFIVRSCPHYSTDIAAAWLVVEHFRASKDDVLRARSGAALREVMSMAHYYTAEQVSAAICRAALSVEVDA